MLLWLHLAPVFSGFQGGRFSPLLAATLKYDSIRTKTDDSDAKISKQNMGRGRASPSGPISSALRLASRELRSLDPLLLSDNSHPGFGRTSGRRTRSNVSQMAPHSLETILSSHAATFDQQTFRTKSHYDGQIFVGRRASTVDHDDDER